MNRRYIWIAFSVSAICLLRVAQQASAAFFVPLGYLPNSAYISIASDVSADGSVVVGNAKPNDYTSFLDVEPFRWTRADGMIGLGNLSGASGGWASGVSADGSVVVGTSISGYYVTEAFHWTSDGGMVGLGVQSGNSSSDASAVSADGLVVVGSNFTSLLTGVRPGFRWTSAHGMIELSDLPGGDINILPTDLSADGSVIVGWSSASTGDVDVPYAEAFRWTSDAGMVGLGDLPGGIGSYAEAVSSDGSVIVGHGSASAGGVEAFRWTSGSGMVGLGDLPGGTRASLAQDVSADGSIVVGGSNSERGSEAFLWDAINGMRSLSDVLTDMDIDVSGWMLTSATAISADGTTIVGYGVNPFGRTEAWLANITITIVPEPTGAIILIGLALPLLVWRRAARRL